MDQETRSISHAAAAMSANPEMRSAVESSSLFSRLKSGLKTVTIDGQVLYVAEGDTLLDEDQLGVYALTREKVEEALRVGEAADMAGFGRTAIDDPGRSALVAITQSGRVVRWKPGTVLSYRVVRNTFTSSQRYDLVVDAMRQATGDWERTCGVSFRHLDTLDTAPGIGPGGALFAVRELNAGGAFIAAAFFPNDPIDRRRVVIDPSFFLPTLSFDRVGVLRHELGHVLGFRHEHIRSGAPPTCPDEPTFDTANLTKYDPQSVMHYFCGGVGSTDLRITTVDINGSRQVYGLPLSQVEEVGE